MSKSEIIALLAVMCLFLFICLMGMTFAVLVGRGEDLETPSAEAAEDIELPVEKIAATNMDGHTMTVYLLNKRVPCVVYRTAYKAGMACDFENGLDSSLLEGFR